MMTHEICCLDVFLVARLSKSTVFGADAVVGADSGDNSQCHKRQLR